MATSALEREKSIACRRVHAKPSRLSGSRLRCSCVLTTGLLGTFLTVGPSIVQSGKTCKHESEGRRVVNARPSSEETSDGGNDCPGGSSVVRCGTDRGARVHGVVGTNDQAGATSADTRSVQQKSQPALTKVLQCLLASGWNQLLKLLLKDQSILIRYFLYQNQSLLIQN